MKDRRDGRVRLPQHALRKSVRDSTIGADIVFLQTALNWAVEQHRLDRNPLWGYHRPKTAKPRRPLATYDRYLKLRAIADKVDPRFGAFMALVEGLGWRVSAICQLKAEDIDRKARPKAPNGRILKRSETDKERVEMWLPLSEDTRRALDQVPVLSGYLFPSPKEADRPWTRFHARDLLERAEKLASLEPGGGFHAYRRKWATERKHLALKDVMEAGGWIDPRSLETCYQQVDEDSLLAVVTEPRKLRETSNNTVHNTVHGNS